MDQDQEKRPVNWPSAAIAMFTIFCIATVCIAAMVIGVVGPGWN